MVYFVDEVYAATLKKDFLYYLLALSEGCICIFYWLEKALSIIESKLGQSTSSDQVLIFRREEKKNYNITVQYLSKTNNTVQYCTWMLLIIAQS